MCSGRMQGHRAQSQGSFITGGRSGLVLGDFSGKVQGAGYGILEEVHTAGPGLFLPEGCLLTFTSTLRTIQGERQLG